MPNNTRGHSSGFYTRRRNNIMIWGRGSRTADRVAALVSTKRVTLYNFQDIMSLKVATVYQPYSCVYSIGVSPNPRKYCKFSPFHPTSLQVPQILPISCQIPASSASYPPFILNSASSAHAPPFHRKSLQVRQILHFSSQIPASTANLSQINAKSTAFYPTFLWICYRSVLKIARHDRGCGGGCWCCCCCCC